MGKRYSGQRPEDKPVFTNPVELDFEKRRLFVPIRSGSPTPHPSLGDHGSLAGLADDDHPQYFLLSGEAVDAILNNDTFIKFGGVALLGYETADANAHRLILALPDGGVIDVPVLAIGNQSILNADLGIFNGESNPAIAIFNASADAFLFLSSGDGRAGLYFIPAADEDVQLVEVNVTGTPRVKWDESEDKFSSNKGWNIIGDLDVTGYLMGGMVLDGGVAAEDSINSSAVILDLGGA